MPEWTRSSTPTTLTVIHKNLHATLWGLGFDVEDEYHVGPYSLDCYLEELHLGFEADGQKYHKAAKDAVRDAWILENSGIPILRIKDYDLKRSNDPETVKMIEAFIDEYGVDVKERKRLMWSWYD